MKRRRKIKQISKRTYTVGVEIVRSTKEIIKKRKRNSKANAPIQKEYCSKERKGERNFGIGDNQQKKGNTRVREKLLHLENE